MKKNTIKAFTLVEMLIVIVIIGILIASLMPRMQTAQGRARDVARKNDLSQIQTAIITSQSDRGEWPQLDTAKIGTQVDTIKNELLKAGMSEVPADPNGSNDNYGVGGEDSANKGEATLKKDNPDNAGKYLYYVGKRNGVADAGFVLMAKTEVEGSSNWVVCDSATATKDLDHGYITDDIDLADIVLCKKVTQDDTAANCKSYDAAQYAAGTWNGECVYTSTSELRYILLY